MPPDLSRCLYNRYSDNLARTADITVLGATIESGYLASWVADHQASRPLRLVDTSGVIQFALPTPAEVLLVGIFHHNFEPGLDVRLLGRATDPGGLGGWSSPDFSAQLPIVPWRVDRFPYNPWLDLTGASGMASCGWWAIAAGITGGPNAVALSIGDIWLGDRVRDFTLQWGGKPSVSRPIIEHRTAFKKLRSQTGTTMRARVGSVASSPELNPNAREDIFDWMLDADGRPFMFVEEDTADPPDAWLAIHTQTIQEAQEEWAKAEFLDIQVEEDGRGLEPTPSPLP